jgi:CubicO group peptidase (beta-lactamase class C family)
VRHGFAAAAFLAAAAIGQEPADLSPILATVVAEQGVPALGAAVLQKGKLVALGAAGRRRIDREEKVTADDLWHLGSCTKAMTATMIARLVERGTLRMEQKLPELFPERKASMREEWAEVTLRQLLDHRAGMPANAEGAAWRALRAGQDAPRKARSVLLDHVLAEKPLHAPGSTFLYSNVGFMVAGAAVERATDAAFEAKLKELLFTPLGMSSAGFGAPGRPEAFDQPCGHAGSGKDLHAAAPGPGADNPAAMAPAGTVHCTLRDWAKFAALHLGLMPAAKQGEAPFLKPETLAMLHEPVAGDYSCGFGVTARPWSKGRILTHNGSNTMWFCVIWLAPAEQFGVLVTCNAADEHAQKACDVVAARMVKDYAR